MDYKNKNKDSNWSKDGDYNHNDSPLPWESNKDNQLKDQENSDWSDSILENIQKNSDQSYDQSPDAYGSSSHDLAPPDNYNQHNQNNWRRLDDNSSYNPTIKGKSNGPAIAGFILALTSIFLFLVPVLNLILAAIGLNLSIKGTAKSKILHGAGRGLATAGTIISSIFIGLSILSLLVMSLWIANDLMPRQRDEAREREIYSMSRSLNKWVEENNKLPQTTAEMKEALQGVDFVRYDVNHDDIKSIKKAQTNGSGIYFTPDDDNGPKLPTSDEVAPDKDQIHIITGVKCVFGQQLKSSNLEQITYNDGDNKIIEETDRLVFAIIYALEHERYDHDKEVDCRDNFYDTIPFDDDTIPLDESEDNSGI